LVGGTPCQSFSVAGLRKGLDDPRGNLALTYLGILDQFRPKWCVWENVPGVLSSGGGRDFGSFLGALGELGYGFAYRVLDAQNFGVAQRRKRVFVVGHLGNWKPAAEVLFESESLSGNIEKGRKTREAATNESIPSVANCIQTTCNDYSRADGFNMIAVGAFGKNIADTVTAKFAKGAELLQQGAQNGGNCVLQPIHCVDTFPTLLSSTAGVSRPGNETTEHQTYIAYQNMAVRRLTPVECERLQGFPDNYTNIPKAADTNRYKALGNSMAVPVMRWIGERINQYEQRGVA
jgi:DNA (cytosine-5)-methyltransferase 1